MNPSVGVKVGNLFSNLYLTLPFASTDVNPSQNPKSKPTLINCFITFALTYINLAGALIDSYCFLYSSGSESKITITIVLPSFVF